MKDELGMFICKIVSSVFLVSILEPMFQFIVLYNPFYGIIGVFGNSITIFITTMMNENDPTHAKKMSTRYHIATFFVSFGLAMMFSGYASEKFGVVQFITALMIGIFTKYAPELLDKAYKKLIKKAES